MHAIQQTDKDLLQATLEELFDKHQLVPTIKREMAGVPAFAEAMAKHSIDPAFGVSLLTQMAIHKRCSISTLVGIMRGYCKDTQATADALYKCADADLVDFDMNTGKFITIATLSAELQAQIDKYQYPLPMVVPPNVLRTNKDSAYRFRKNDSVILKNNHHNDDVCLDHLNRTNKIKLSVDERVVTKIQNSWRNLDKPKEAESVADYQKRVAAFTKYDRSAKDVIKLLVDEGNEFYLTHKYDKRGRTYPAGYQVNYQGNPWCKAIVVFANKELL